MKNKFLFLRITYWVGIILDTGAAILLMFPPLAAWFYNWSSYQPSPVLNSISGMGAALMWGWTGLLFWADRKPVERRGVLLLTVFPVVTGLMITKILDTQAGLAPWFPAGLIQPVLIALFLFAFFTAQGLARGQNLRPGLDR